MMIGALYEYALREGLLEDPDVEPLAVDFFLEVADDGRFLALVPTADEAGRVPRRVVPRVPKRSGTSVVASFFVDNAKYVLAHGGDAAKARLNPARNKAFRELVDAAAKETQDPAARAVSAFLGRLDSERPRILKQRAEWTGEERLAFRWSGDDAQLVHERPALREAWRRKRSAEEDDGGRPMRCLVTGRWGPVARLHPSVKRVPGAQPSGASLVSFNEEAFCSHGLDQGYNAPISRPVAEGYVTALNHMLSGDGERRYRRGVALGKDAVAVFWTREAEQAVDALLALLDAPAARQEDSTPPGARQALHFAEAPLRGLEPAAFDDKPFYALVLGGNAARVVVREWFESSVQDLKQSLREWFDDLRLEGGRGRPLSLWQLLRAVEPPGRDGNPPDLAGRLLAAAMMRRPLPRELLAAALRRLRVPDKGEAPGFLLYARCALIKATLLRLRRLSPQLPEVSVALNPDSPEVSYQLGRLFAVLERLQYAALGEVNASIKDRYFGAAMANPGLVMPRLIRLSTAHAAKADRAGRWLDKLMGQIMDRFPSKSWPHALTLEAQGLFAVGYYQQREDFFRKAAPAEAERPEA
ncbi:type I-C CRISPR-associated protein Cas8c/Csd1 [Corallococcus interemptor]|uniref:Type I-C CRISPR-associated protein Cas8c/Csd1 n=1 Tax=Corallococcus interemptor TaxID=2316720 RepID=A0A3A8QKR7_9BACT|nr:type I-C CRISPR-associated protein Cas8c/Csd1 [Corallococcus interemptor]RKH69366.1 type I-C CRISPR-associated protein Cas8c/Csd1 [Corallococcus interemptor]